MASGFCEAFNPPSSGIEHFFFQTTLNFVDKSEKKTFIKGTVNVISSDIPLIESNQE